jgi:D-threo-aldose 1-dehydrogenase
VKVSQRKSHQRSGLTFTALGFGGAPIGNFNGVSTDDEAHDMVEQSWHARLPRP